MTTSDQTNTSTPAPNAQSTPPVKPLQRTMLMLVLAAVVVVGFMIFWMSRRTGPATVQCQAFIQELIAGNLQSAKARCVPGIDFESMQRLADKETGKMRFWGKLTDANYVEKSSGDRADVDGRMTLEKLFYEFQACLELQPDGTFVIRTYGFNFFSPAKRLLVLIDRLS
jgi:hypothetical protein